MNLAATELAAALCDGLPDDFAGQSIAARPAVPRDIDADELTGKIEDRSSALLGFGMSVMAEYRFEPGTARARASGKGVCDVPSGMIRPATQDDGHRLLFAATLNEQADHHSGL